jgi:hypothetical protein
MLETSDLIILSLLVANYKPREMWKALVRLVVRLLQQSGKSYSKIRKETGLKHSTIQGILKGPSSRITRKGKTFKLQLLKSYKSSASFYLFLSLRLTALSPKHALKLNSSLMRLLLQFVKQ